MTIGQKLKIRIPTNGKNRYYEGKLLMWNGVYGTIDCNGKHTPAKRDQYLQYINNLTYNIRIEEGNK